MKSSSFLNLLILLLGLGVMSGCTSPRSPFGEQEKQAIRDTINGLMAQITSSVQQADADAAFQWLSDDSAAVFISGGLPYSKTGLISRFRNLYSFVQEQHFETENSRVVVFSPDAAAWIAVIRGTHLTKDGVLHDEFLLETWIWQHENAGWRVVHYHESFPTLPGRDEKARVETALAELVVQLKGKVLKPADMPPILTAFLTSHPKIYGTTLAFAPVEQEGKKHGAAPYVYRTPTGFSLVELPESFDYTLSEWYAGPVEKQAPRWSDPYYDAGGGGVGMITYGIPLYDSSNNLIGVLTADLEVR